MRRKVNNGKNLEKGSDLRLAGENFGSKIIFNAALQGIYESVV